MDMPVGPVISLETRRCGSGLATPPLSGAVRADLGPSNDLSFQPRLSSMARAGQRHQMLLGRDVRQHGAAQSAAEYGLTIEVEGDLVVTDRWAGKRLFRQEAVCIRRNCTSDIGIRRPYLRGCEQLREQVEAILSGVASRMDPGAALAEALDAISQASGCESVGIRWKAGEDYPYHVTRGFGRDFVVIEGPLCERDTAGLVLRYPDGTPQYACMCGAVVTGRADPRLPFFTEGGSFWPACLSRAAAHVSPIAAPGWPP